MADQDDAHDHRESAQAPGRDSEDLREGRRDRQGIGRISGSYTGLYEPGYLDDLRAEWPE